MCKRDLWRGEGKWQKADDVICEQTVSVTKSVTAGFRPLGIAMIFTASCEKYQHFDKKIPSLYADTIFCYPTAFIQNYPASVEHCIKTKNYHKALSIHQLNSKNFNIMVRIFSNLP